MIKYPNGKKVSNLSTTKSTGQRGMSLEYEINISNQYFIDIDKAIIYKKPTPVQVVHVDYPKRSAAKIDEAYFKTPSTTDYNGIYKGRYIDFEAKETNSKTSFPFSSMHPHQIEHLTKVLNHGAIAFILIRFNNYNETYYVEATKFITCYQDLKKRSIPYSWFKEHAYLIPYSLTPPINYIQVIEQLHFKGGKNNESK